MPRCRWSKGPPFDVNGVPPDNGCTSPLPELCELDAAAWMVFQDCATQWEFCVGPFGGALRIRLLYDMAKLAAEAHGYEFDGALLDRVRVCERWLLAHDRKKAAQAKAGERFDEEAVN